MNNFYFKNISSATLPNRRAALLKYDLSIFYAESQSIFAIFYQR